MTAFLVSRACEVSGEAFVAMAGWYGRVFVGKAKGWLAPDTESVSVEDIADHFDDIRDMSKYTVPADTWEDLTEVAAAIADASDT